MGEGSPSGSTAAQTKPLSNPGNEFELYSPKHEEKSRYFYKQSQILNAIGNLNLYDL